MMHDGAFQYISYIYRVSAPSIPKISFLPVLEPTEKISNTHTYEHTYIRTHSPLLYRLSQFPLNLQILLHPRKVYFSFSMQCIETKPPFCHQWVIVLIKGALTPTPNQTGISFGPKLIAKSHVSRGTFRLLPSSAQAPA